MHDYFSQLVSLSEEVKAYYNRLNGLQSLLDRKVSAIYHDIEKNDIDAISGHDYALKLKETLQSRRIVKDELARLSPVYHMLRQQMETVEDQHEKAMRKSAEIRGQLNVSGDIGEVLMALEA
ncbi:hypothetical protein [Bacillus massilinigeriensis]|uniref:hypothetical protein n=1 Tax=Bacillus mediterraneensis TaxID=1805474 RepID=UPI0008F911DE|nr:hypothetical protein [Bacillus mediterraneensis]